jgi:hypothetical protein
MSDEAHFHLSGYVNKQTFQYWANINTCKLQLAPAHSVKLTVCCVILSFGIIGPYFFEDDKGNAVTVTYARYVLMVQNFVTQELTQFPQMNENTWFQQDGATSHTARNSINVMQQLFPHHIISRFGNISWPTR